MIKRAAVFGLFLGIAFSAMAADSRLEEARQALDDGLPQVAIFKLRKADGKWTAPEDRSAAELLLGRALFAAGRFEESADLLKKIPDSEADFWRAESLSSLGRNQEAFDLYRKLAGDGVYASRAVIGEARMLRALGQSAEAASVLAEFLKQDSSSNDVILELAETQLAFQDSRAATQSLSLLKDPSPEQKLYANYLGARALMLSGRLSEAEQKLRAINDPPADIAFGITLSLAECRLKLKDAPDAEKILEQFIELNPRLPGIANVFSALDHVYAAQSEPSSSELKKWAEDPKNNERKAFAEFYRARNEARLSRADLSRQLYAGFIAQYPSHPLVDLARTELAQSLLVVGNGQEALAVAQKGKGLRIDFLQGQALAALARYKEAAAKFLQAAALPEIEIAALTNSAVCAALADVPDADNAAIQQLQQRPDSGEVLDKILFIEAMHHAAQRKPDAADLLQKVAVGESRWASQARLALAEWDNLQLDLDGATKEMSQFRRISNTDPAQKERADYLAVFLADTGEPEADVQVGKLAEAFLKMHPDSVFAPEVRMKLGEMLYRRGDYLGAHAQFRAITEKSTDAPLVEKANFLWAQALARSLNPDSMEEAVDIYERVAKGGGPLALRARLSQAMLFYSLKRPKQAIEVLDTILAAKPDEELRCMALIEKGDALFAQGVEDPQNFSKAIASWNQIVTDPTAPKIWSHQAWVKMGAANEKLGRNDEALNCYYNVFSQGQKGEPEYFWYYKAGFDAGSLLETQNLWKEAIAVYDKIGSIEGPRAEEARDKVNKLRLENFIWGN